MPNNPNRAGKRRGGALSYIHRTSTAKVNSVALVTAVDVTAQAAAAGSAATASPSSRVAGEPGRVGGGGGTQHSNL
jgi:3-oxoacyl-ACP reductase-like protein